MRAKGIDISHWQETFKYQGNLDFIILKATEGEEGIDPKFIEFLELPRKPCLDLLTGEYKVPEMGAYHYFRTEYDGVIQAQHFYNETNHKGLNFLAVDYEGRNNELDADGEAELRDFWDHLVSLTNKPVLLYTSPYIFRDNLCHYSNHWLNVPLWIAHYNYQDSQEGEPEIFDAREWKFWQWTSEYNGKLYGVGTENVDQNVYNGTVEQLLDWLRPEGEPTMKKWYQSKTLWFSILFALVNIAGVFGFAEFVPGDELVNYVNIGISVIVALLRVFTSEGIQP